MLKLTTLRYLLRCTGSMRPAAGRWETSIKAWLIVLISSATDVSIQANADERMVRIIHYLLTSVIIGGSFIFGRLAVDYWLGEALFALTGCRVLNWEMIPKSKMTLWPPYLNLERTRLPRWPVSTTQNNNVITEGPTQSPGQALTLTSEDDPKFIGRTLSEI